MFYSDLNVLTSEQRAQLALEELFQEFPSHTSNGIIERSNKEEKLEFKVNDTLLAVGFDFWNSLYPIKRG